MLLLLLLRQVGVIVPALAELLDLRASRKGYRAALLADCMPCSCCCSCCCVHQD